MTKRSIKPFRPVHPSPAAMLTCVAPDGRANIITLAEVFNVSIADPVIVGIAIAKPRWSHELITASGEYVVNLPTAAMVEVVDRCGTVSGRDVDKFAEFGLTAIPAEQVAPPLIAECPINVECRVIGIQEIGDHDLFLGQAVAELDALCYLHSKYWSCGKELGFHGFTAR